MVRLCSDGWTVLTLTPREPPLELLQGQSQVVLACHT